MVVSFFLKINFWLNLSGFYWCKILIVILLRQIFILLKLQFFSSFYCKKNKKNPEPELFGDYWSFWCYAAQKYYS